MGKTNTMQQILKRLDNMQHSLYWHRPISAVTVPYVEFLLGGSVPD
jgi:hypothetical protein